jgi:aldehyde dehydrogenase (NAD+)
LFEYVRRDPADPADRADRADPADPADRADRADKAARTDRAAPRPPIDRTYKLYLGGKQVRPDSGYSIPIDSVDGTRVAEVGLGNRKDIRNAVEAARAAAPGWAKATAHLRAQILYYVGENLSLRSDELARGIARLTGVSKDRSIAEVELAVRRCFQFAAWADKYDGRVHPTPFRNVTVAMNEPIGVIGLVAPEEPSLVGFLSVVLPAVAMGNTVVVVPSERWPVPALDCSQIFDTSDVPAGVINIVTGKKAELVPVVAGHDDIDAVWYFGSAAGSGEVERLSAGNMKRTWVDNGTSRNWLDPDGALEEFLREATQVKNIWVPYGA